MTHKTLTKRVRTLIGAWALLGICSGAVGNAAGRAPQDAADQIRIEVSEIPNYRFSDFKWGEHVEGDFMIGTFTGKETFKGAVADKYPGDVEVRVRLRGARVVDSYLSYEGRRISRPVTPGVERILLRQPRWNRGPDCVPRREVYSYSENKGGRLRECQVVLIVPKNCPARVASILCADAKK